MDLPLGLLPVRMGHEFKIELEDDIPPIHKPIYKLSTLKVEETKKQIQYMLVEMATEFLNAVRVRPWFF